MLNELGSRGVGEGRDASRAVRRSYFSTPGCPLGVLAGSTRKEVLMRYGFVIPTGDPQSVADLAHEAEAAGWDGAFYWDGMFIGSGEVYDPWVVMAAMALRTE